MDNDYGGKISAKFYANSGIETFCAKHILHYDPKRFYIVAIRVFAAKEFIITIYMEDKLKDLSTIHPGKILVKKFKIENVTPEEFFDLVEAFNFTLSNDNYDLDNMEVINK
ncbi:MAG: hypothetical protein Q8L81_17025 [Bacteroidota bacterium]|nr:hypothetical protein [Bacteroidota bacterium]